MSAVAVLFARADSCYKLLAGADVCDAERDARKWPGGAPVVAHPPCRAWGGLSHMAHNVRPDEKELSTWAVDQVRKFGGVLEHPRRSKLWEAKGLPEPGQRDKFGGWTLQIFQSDWGHKAKKATRLYIVGCEPADIPDMPLVMGEASHVVGSSRRTRPTMGGRPEIKKAEREHTPPALAAWLFDLAIRCKVAA